MHILKTRIYQPGILAMAGMPLMLMFFLIFKAARKVRVMEINYPSKKMLNEMKSEKDTSRFNILFPKGNFYNVSLDVNSWNYPIDKYRCHKLLANHALQPDEIKYDGLHVKLTKYSTYSDYIFLQNQMLIYGINIWFFIEDEFYCYFEEKMNKNYPPVLEKAKAKPTIECGNVGFEWKCNYFIPQKEESLFKEIIQPHLTYWYFWALYLLIVFFSIKKLKSNFGRTNHKNL